MVQELREPNLFRMQTWQKSGQEELHQTFLVWPWTFMNRSGAVFSGFPQILGPPSTSVLVLVDDLSLPLGQMRLRRGGSAGGHNGLKSIEEALGTQEYPRLRLGIGHPGSEIPVVEYVLCPFDPTELSTVGTVTDAAAQAVERWLSGEEFSRVVQAVNGWRLPQETDAGESMTDSEASHAL